MFSKGSAAVDRGKTSGKKRTADRAAERGQPKFYAGHSLGGDTIQQSPWKNRKEGT
jgi:hypothetical protein